MIDRFYKRVMRSKGCCGEQAQWQSSPGGGEVHEGEARSARCLSEVITTTLGNGQGQLGDDCHMVSGPYVSSRVQPATPDPTRTSRPLDSFGLF